ncbi:MAG: hypothetical protein IPH07_07825 [Deltaproteobacteria bacterium]|nr:hypothetical protein [Deltaproteobacteria bacterium]MBK8717726.1 hypothetical protein [Deltaproteobacteria bacterium]MBP7288777.1 hypothetical protein [Nannocystaceae bacterium]
MALRRTWSLVMGAAMGMTACGGDDGKADGGADTTDGTADTSASGPSSSATDTAESVDSGPGPGECGNGMLDGDEQCDNGADNSDTVPDACRTDCRTAHCADGVIDPSLGEECDDGNLNSNMPDACRVTCVLPTCGDGVKDVGEPCDDGNEMWGDTCHECSNLWYFVLNSPDQSGGGDVSILRSTRDGAPVQVVGGDSSLNGIVQIELGPMGTPLFALQSDGAVDRVVVLDPIDGAMTGEVALDAAVLGADPELQGLALGSDGVLYVAGVAGGNTQIVPVDITALTAGTPFELGSDLGVVDMTADDAGMLYVSTGTTGGSMVQIDPVAMSSTTFLSGFENPIGIAFDAAHHELWVADNPAGAPSYMVRSDLMGNAAPYATAGTDNNPYVHGVAIDIGGVVLTTQRAYDRVVAVQNFDAVQDFFTEMIVDPTDLVILDMKH